MDLLNQLRQDLVARLVDHQEKQQRKPKFYSHGRGRRMKHVAAHCCCNHKGKAPRFCKRHRAYVLEGKRDR